MVSLSVKLGIFQSIWKSAVVTPIFKVINKITVWNYRPISILSAENWNEGVTVGGFFILQGDLNKVFDTVNHKVVLFVFICQNYPSLIS